jgi:hypothetical protein
VPPRKGTTLSADVAAAIERERKAGADAS